MSIMKAADLLQKLIDAQWDMYIEPAVRALNSQGKTTCDLELKDELCEDLLTAPMFKEQLLKAGYDVHLQKNKMIRAISWKNATPDRKEGMEIYPEDEATECEQEDEETDCLECESSESNKVDKQNVIPDLNPLSKEERKWRNMRQLRKRYPIK